MTKEIQFESNGYKYTARYDEYYGYYWVKSDTGYTFKMTKEELDNVIT